MVYSHICLLEHRCALKLVGRNLVVASLYRDAKSVRLLLKLFHKVADPLRDSTPIVVVQLLILSGGVTH